MPTTTSQPRKSDFSPDKDDVSAALRLLADSLDEEEKRIRGEGSKAMHEGDYDTATAVIDFAKRLLAFQKKVAGLEKEWDDLEDLRDKATPAVQEIVSKRFFGRSKRGDITPQEAYCAPILQVLTEMGGSGKTKDVIAKVGLVMKGLLKPNDYEKTATRAKELRWENTTRWARQRMVEDGRLKSDSPNGTWEISNQGRAWLKKS
jgi:restriction system protein